jgi:hypothetical protein
LNPVLEVKGLILPLVVVVRDVIWVGTDVFLETARERRGLVNCFAYVEFRDRLLPTLSFRVKQKETPIVVD